MRAALVASLLLVFAPGLAAAKSPVLVELYTAQGCASCVDAGAALAKTAERPDVLALTFSVDYWDYLGWPDTFAQPQFTARQKAYVARLALREPYTPQMVINGRFQTGAKQTEKIDLLISKAASTSRSSPDLALSAVGVWMWGMDLPPRAVQRSGWWPMTPAPRMFWLRRATTGVRPLPRSTSSADSKNWGPGGVVRRPTACPKPNLASPWLSLFRPRRGAHPGCGAQGCHPQTRPRQTRPPKAGTGDLTLTGHKNARATGGSCTGAIAWIFVD